MVTNETGSGIQHFRGFSHDVKPGLFSEQQDGLGGIEILEVTIKAGSTFTERDTGRKYIWDGQAWIQQEQTIEVFIQELQQTMLEVLDELKSIRMATAIQANGAWDAQIPTVR